MQCGRAKSTFGGYWLSEVLEIRVRQRRLSESLMTNQETSRQSDILARGPRVLEAGVWYSCFVQSLRERKSTRTSGDGDALTCWCVNCASTVLYTGTISSLMFPSTCPPLSFRVSFLSFITPAPLTRKRVYICVKLDSLPVYLLYVTDWHRARTRTHTHTHK